MTPRYRIVADDRPQPLPFAADVEARWTLRDWAWRLGVVCVGAAALAVTWIVAGVLGAWLGGK